MQDLTRTPQAGLLSARIIDRSYLSCWLPLVEFLSLGAAGTVDHKHDGVSVALSLALASAL